MAYPLFVTLSFFVSPLLSLFFVLHGFLTSDRYRRWFGFLVSLFVGIILYHVIPDASMDLYRYYGYMDQLKALQFKEAIETIWSQNDPLAYTIMYILSSVFNNQAIPFTMAVVGYAIYFWILFDFVRLRKLKSFHIAVVILGFLSVYHIVGTFTGVRFGLATAIFALALYLDTVKSKRKLSLALYALSPLLHSSMITLILVRCVMAVFKKRSSIFGYLAVLAIGLSSQLLYYLSTLLSNLPFLNILSTRAEYYLQPNSPDGSWYPFSVALSVVMLITLLLVHRKENVNKNLLKFTILIFIIALANVANFYIAIRYIGVGRTLFAICMIDIIYQMYRSGFFAKYRILTYVCVAVWALFVVGSILAQIMALRYLDFGDLMTYSPFNSLFKMLAS